MSRTRLHKMLGIYKATFKTPFILQKFFDRHNFDVGEMKEQKQLVKDKISKKDMQSEIDQI
jgi:hypothetical protein